MPVQRCAVLLRGVNVGKGNRLAMADFRAVLAEIGCTDVATYLNSGNAVVTAETTGLAARVESALPLKVPVVVVTAAELAAAVDECPFRAKAEQLPKKVHVTYLSELPTAQQLAGLAAAKGEDEFAVGKRVLYLSFTGPSVDSPLTAALGKARLGAVVTTRNWTTAVKLAELADTTR